MPFPSDVKTLVEKYNVKSVINMCGEYPGPQNHYKHYGVEQLRLPRVDTTVPYVEQLKLGAAFILKRKMEEPDARIFIHCKGGIARASCMTLAHYILNKSVKDTKKQLGIMKEKRPVVFEGVADFHSIQTLVGSGGEKDTNASTAPVARGRTRSGSNRRSSQVETSSPPAVPIPAHRRAVFKRVSSRGVSVGQSSSRGRTRSRSSSRKANF